MRLLEYIWVLGIMIIPLTFESAVPDLSEVARESLWVTSTYDDMSLDERLGQLFMIRAYSKGDTKHEKFIESLIARENIGGLCFFQGSPAKQLELTNRYQSKSKIPLLISIDAEWGLGMRFKDRAISFPRQLTLGAIQDNEEIYQFGLEVAAQLKRLGVHINFAPVVDINNNPKNPVINDRSFGEDRQKVTAKAFAYMRGMQDGGIMACAKHFPGHGDTDVDSHLDLPLITHDEQRLDSLELFPFKILSQHGMASVMIAHLNVPALDQASNVPSTLSRPIVTDLLKREIGFQGLVITDALDMKGVSKFYNPGELEAKAFEAGNDILLLSEDVRKAKQAIKAYLKEGKITNAQIEAAVKKILLHKFRMGLFAAPKIEEDNLYNEIITADAVALKGRLYEKALTLVRDQDEIVPIQQTTVGEEIGVLTIGSPTKTVFQKRLDSYENVAHFNTGLDISLPRAHGLRRALNYKDIVIISLHNYKKTPSNNYGLSSQAIQLIREIATDTKVILVLFGSPYVLQHFDDVDNVIVAYEGDELAEDFAAQALFGVTSFSGKLPVKASVRSALGAGIVRKANGRMGYVMPEVVGMSSDTLDEIKKLAEELIRKKAAPGCQVLVSKDGRVVFHEAFGYHDYTQSRKVQRNDVYDLASITKIAATTIALMKLQDEGLLDIDAPLKRYFPEMEATNKGDLIISDVLAHHAKLIGWIPFYENTLIDVGLSDKWYRVQKESPYSLQVCEKVYLRDDFLDTIFTQIICSDLRDTNDYRYSDLGFYIFDRLVQKQTGLRLDKYCEKFFYKPLGLRFAGYNPRARGIPKEMIPPTEEDNYFRNQVVQGFVHDMGAAMQSGVAGHAGLFSNAHDLAVIMQMLINNGEYGGRQYLKPETIERFTQRHKLSTRRGLGFDMKEQDEDKTANMCEEASTSTFGHLGFTGTATWADPENGLVFVFLSNRTYPSMNNNTLHKENYRPKIQSVAYRALINK